jgi:F420-0:gamma-glutamyl ligase
MTQDEIIEMAEQAGFDCYGEHITWDDVICTDELNAFAELVAAKEREACAKVVDDWSDWHGGTELIAKAIRARGQA